MRDETARTGEKRPTAPDETARPSGERADAARRMIAELMAQDAVSDPRCKDGATTVHRARRGIPAPSGRMPGNLLLRFIRRDDAPRHVATALLVIVLVSMPWETLTVILLSAAIATIACALLGEARLSGLAARWYTRTRESDPERAEAVRLKAQAASRFVARQLARLPAGWTSGLYLPDFDEPAPLPGKMLSDPFERLEHELR